jgi:hypothetical protein
MALFHTDPLTASALLCAFIAALAAVQSVFGVGLLIFGTPVLLFIGAGFDAVLSTLLPASLTVSVLQIVCDGRPAGLQIRGFFIYMLPALGAGLLVALVSRAPGIDIVICGLLIFAALLRVSPRHRQMLMALARRFSRTMLVCIGLVHGLTNMGGSLLEVYVSSRESEKLNIRQGIACGYALLAASQLIVLALAGRLQLSLATGASVLVAGGVFLSVGRRSFSPIRQAQYTAMVSALMVLAAISLMAKRALS